jgi:heterodisulfide reductase subunit A
MQSPHLCNSCGDCIAKCPVKISSEFDEGFGARKAIYTPFPQAVPSEPVIDREHCTWFLKDGKCGVCEKVCTLNAIDYTMEDEIVELSVGTIIVATGFDEFDPNLKPELGYGIYDNVITGLEMERLCSASGPTEGKIEIGGKIPSDVVFIKCVGSRDQSIGNEYCSRVCCMFTAKQAHLVREKLPDANITVFYMDVRAFGKGYEEFYDRVRNENVIYRRGSVSEIYKRGERLVVTGEDTLVGEPLEVEADLVVLAAGLTARKDTDPIASVLKLSKSSDRFLMEAHPKLRPVDTAIDGVFLAGCCQGPKDIPDTVAQAKGAAASAIIPMSRGTVRLEAISAVVDEDRCSGCRICVSVCPYEAITYDEKDKVSRVNEALCKGCGTCGAACPSGAMSTIHFTSGQMRAQVLALIGGSDD